MAAKQLVLIKGCRGLAGNERFACWLCMAARPPTQVYICQAVARSLWQADVYKQLSQGGNSCVAVGVPMQRTTHAFGARASDAEHRRQPHAGTQLHG